MRRVEKLIKQARRIADNEEFDNDPSNPLGIVDDELVEYVNDAQDNMQAAISEVHPKLFIKEKLIDLVAEQETYSLPDDLYLGGRIEHVEALYSTQAGDYYTLPHESLKRRLPDVSSTFPDFYIRKANNLLIQPKPSGARTNGIRLSYQYKLPTLDIRRGLVASAVDTGTSITSITLNLTPTLTRDADLVLIPERTIEDFDFLTVVGSDGTAKMKAIPVDSYDSDTGIITVTSGFTYETGETITAGDYIIGGKDATTHSDLPDTCQRYLIAYMAWKMLKRDSMVDLQDQERELAAMLREIVNAFKGIDEDPAELALDEDWLI